MSSSIILLIFRKTLVDVKEFRDVLFQTLDEKFKGAVLVTENHAALYNYLVAPKFHFQICDEKVLSANLVIYYPKKSYLNRHIDNLILQFQANGLIEQLTNIFVDKKYLKPPKYNHEPTKLSLVELKGGFQICSIGILVAFFVFFAEFLSKFIHCVRVLIEF